MHDETKERGKGRSNRKKALSLILGVPLALVLFCITCSMCGTVGDGAIE
jgi:hypothetical protein